MGALSSISFYKYQAVNQGDEFNDEYRYDRAYIPSTAEGGNLYELLKTPTCKLWLNLIYNDLFMNPYKPPLYWQGSTSFRATTPISIELLPTSLVYNATSKTASLAVNSYVPAGKYFAFVLIEALLPYDYEDNKKSYRYLPAMDKNPEGWFKRIQGIKFERVEPRDLKLNKTLLASKIITVA